MSSRYDELIQNLIEVSKQFEKEIGREMYVDIYIYDGREKPSVIDYYEAKKIMKLFNANERAWTLADTSGLSCEFYKNIHMTVFHKKLQRMVSNEDNIY